jgi:xanthine dehydrogenase accessory factor
MTVVGERVHELTGQRRPFVHATVVRAQAPTSARAGDDAVILDDGSIEGFVGGVCAESSVRAAALDALQDGNSLLLRVLPEDSPDFPPAPGSLVVVNPCLSGGAIEIFLRPVLPKPLLGVAGAGTPIGRAVAELAGFLDFEITSGYAGAVAVVVAGLGRDEEKAIRAALDAEVPFVALVAGRKRAEAVLDSLGLTDAERARVRPHAGIDIGAHTHKEIALAVVAEVVQRYRATAGSAGSAGSAGAGAPALGAVRGGEQSKGTAAGGPGLGARPGDGTVTPARAVDPVCGMTVVVGADTPHAVVDEVEHWFCCAGCRDSFVAAG